MNKIFSVVLSALFLFILFSGPAFSEPHEKNNSDTFLSDDELEKEESVLDMFELDEAEAHPLEKGDENDDENLIKDDDLPFVDFDEEDKKIQSEEEKENIIM